MLTLLVPVKGLSRTYIKNRINVIVTVSVAVIRYCALMFFIPKKNVYETVNTPPTNRTNQITGGTVSFPAKILSRRYWERSLNPLNDSAYSSLLGIDSAPS